MAGVSFGGLFSGLDTENIIKQLIQIERKPITLLEQRKIKLDAEKSEINNINSQLIGLKSTLSGFVVGSILDNVASSSDESILTATADVSASEGTYDITINILAEAQTVASDAKASGATFGGAGDKFRISVGVDGLPAEDFDITLTGASTLTDIAQLINGSTSGTGKDFSDYGQASIITDPSTGNQTLVVKRWDEGTANAMTFTDLVGTVLDDGTGIGILSAGSLKHENPALNADLTIDGVSVVNSTNQVTGAIAGVTLNLTSTGDVTLTVGPDDDAIVDQVKAFVDKFNSVTDLMGAKIAEEPVDKPKTTSDLYIGVLNGDYDIVDVRSQLRLQLMTVNDGFLSGGTAVSGFSTYYDIAQEIGIDSIASSGSYVSANIELDETKLRAALTDDRDAVRAYLEEMSERLDTYLESTTKVSVSQEFAGSLYQRVLGIDDRQKNIDDSISRLEDRVQAEEDRLRASFSSLEEALQRLQSQSSFLTSQLAGLQASASTSKK